MTNKEFQIMLKRYPDDAPIFVFKGYKKEQVKGNVGMVLKENVVPADKEIIAKSKDGKLVLNPPIY